MLKLPVQGGILAVAQGLLGAFRVGQTLHFKAKQVFSRLVHVFGSPWVFLLNLCFFQKDDKDGGGGGGGGGSGHTLLKGEERCARAVLSRTLGTT